MKPLKKAQTLFVSEFENKLQKFMTLCTKNKTLGVNPEYKHKILDNKSFVFWHPENPT